MEGQATPISQTEVGIIAIQSQSGESGYLKN